jgi:uncharacterized protein YbcI
MNEQAAHTDAGTGSGSSKNLLLEISNALVGIHKEYYGRGPTKARMYISDDLVVVVLQGGYSRVEQTLVDTGRSESVLQTRLTMQETMEDTTRKEIERLTGRKVRSFMSGNDPDQELQTEVFLLEPAHAEPVSDKDLADRSQAARDHAAEIRLDHRALRAEQVQARAALQRQREDCEQRRKQQ